MAQVQDKATIIQAIVVQYMNMEIRSEILIDPTKQETQIKKSEERDYSPKPPICQKNP